MLTSKELFDKLSNAKQSVKIIGVVSSEKVDWTELGIVWEKTAHIKHDFSVNILCESDNFLFAKAFSTDNAFSKERFHFEDLKFLRDRVSDDLNYLNWVNGLNFSVELLFTPIPMHIIQIDNETYIRIWLDELNNDYEKIEPTHIWYSKIVDYINNKFDKRQGRKYACTMFDEKNKINETLELYDHNRIPRGIYPRNSFYDTDYSQLVVWALIFDRKGNLLIHRRSDNAKDNKSMWDKSVGGHVDFSLDVDTSRAILREVIEELFTIESPNDNSYESGKFFNVNGDEMIYLGEWRPNQRKKLPFKEINAYKKEWVFFRLKNSQHVYSPRTDKNGIVKRLRVIADVYLFIADNSLDIDSLKNSKFKLIQLSELKSAMDKGLKNEKVEGFDENDASPKFTPDLTNILTGELRDILQEFSQYIKYYSE